MDSTSKEARMRIARQTLTTIAMAAAMVSTIMVGGARAQVAATPCALAPREMAAREAFFRDLIKAFGGQAFQNPPEVRPTSPGTRHTLRVAYTTAMLAGCPVHLRSYNGKLVGETLRVKPGETIYLQVVNDLPPNVENPHPQQPKPDEHADHFSFNLTNLHTHGLHTPPQGPTPQEEGDNVLIEIAPGASQPYSIPVHATHPSGTFWYHPHLHGATAIQVSSGMAGALIVEGGSDAHGGLDTVPVIAQTKAQEKIFVLQQFIYGTDGQIETFDGPAGRNWRGRGVMVNGQLAPIIRMHPGEIQRWRFIHAGVQENIQLSLDQHALHEIADDGLALGRIVSWPSATPINGATGLLLGPGYRADVLVQAAPLAAGETRHTYLLRDRPLTGTSSITFMTAVQRLVTRRATLQAMDFVNETFEKPESIIAQVVVEGEPLPIALPTNAAVQDRVPSELTPITDAEIAASPATERAQAVALMLAPSTCDAGGNCQPCPDDGDCPSAYMVNGKVYMSKRPPRQLTLNSATEWTLTSVGMPHPFHIHVNPFRYERLEPGPDGQPITAPIWKDTVMVPLSAPLVVRSRQTRFSGRFVLHCHILGHEDLGMMEQVEIVKR
jgi:FtsP/CotA-like multicopper oxidase with cupredoxin domain